MIQLFVQFYFPLQIIFLVEISDGDSLDGHLISFESTEKDSCKSASSEFLAFVDFKDIIRNYKEMFKLFFVFSRMEICKVIKLTREKIFEILGSDLQQLLSVSWRISYQLLYCFVCKVFAAQFCKIEVERFNNLY